MKRNTASISTEVDRPEANEQTEYVRMLSISARLRPIRSAMNPNITPPMPEASNVNVPKNPATDFVMPRSRIT